MSMPDTMGAIRVTGTTATGPEQRDSGFQELIFANDRFRVYRPAMSIPAPSVVVHLAANNTVKVPAVLRRRVLCAMAVEGFTVWSEFCRVALTEKCYRIEDNLRTRDPGEYQRIFGQFPAAVPDTRKN